MLNNIITKYLLPVPDMENINRAVYAVAMALTTKLPENKKNNNIKSRICKLKRKIQEWRKRYLRCKV